MDDRFYFRQLLSGRDFGINDPLASQMANFAYVIGDSVTKEALIVDPAYDVAGIVAALEADGMQVTGALATHYHPDHVGGSMMGYDIAGIAELLAHKDVPIHVHAAEAEFVTKVTDVGADHLVSHQSGDKVMVGEIEVELIHTPGHTPGSQCFLVHDHLMSGDTLFLDGCGRTDLPGGDAAELYDSLTKKLAKVADTAKLFPGHMYSPPETQRTMGDTRSRNVVYKPDSVEGFLMMFGQ